MQNPKQFLPKEQWRIPRLNARQEQLRKQIQEALKIAGNYQQFEQRMNAAGYQVLKGRGISFIDDKKVKIKGSEVGFSWQKIERILALKEQVQKNKVYQRFTDQDLINKQVGSSTNFNFSSGN